MKIDTARADLISDGIIDTVNAELKAGTSPTTILAGLCLGLVGYMRSAAHPRPDSFNELGRSAETVLGELLQKQNDSN